MRDVQVIASMALGHMTEESHVLHRVVNISCHFLVILWKNVCDMNRPATYWITYNICLNERYVSVINYCTHIVLGALKPLILYNYYVGLLGDALYSRALWSLINFGLGYICNVEWRCSNCNSAWYNAIEKWIQKSCLWRYERAKWIVFKNIMSSIFEQ